MDKLPLPTIVVIGDKGEKVLCRLPLSLTAWAVDTVAFAHAFGNPLPCEIEFGIIGDRHYAEMI